MAINDFKAFATGVGANVLTQAEYEALTALANGFSAGTARSNELNKVWRQASIMAAVLAQLIVDQTGNDALDDGTTSLLLANLKSAIQGLGSSQSASTTTPGILEIATSAEAITGTDSGRAIVPSALAAVIANLALGTMSKQSAGAVAITGGSISGIADLAIADGGTGASTAAQALANLGGAPLASPALTGNPTAPTAAVGTNNTQIANTAFVKAAIAALVAAAPTTLDTLNELAAALNDDPNFATTMTTALAGKQPLDATLTALAGVVTAADKLIYATGADAFATTALTSIARTLLACADQASMRSAIVVPSGVDKQMCTAWVNFNGTGTVAIRDSFNVSSVADNGTGLYTINFSSPMSNANYGMSGICGPLPNAGIVQVKTLPTVSSVQVEARSADSAAVNAADVATVGITFFGGK